MNKPSDPPKWILRLLDWWVRSELREEIKGDLYELYEEHLEHSKPAKAKRAFIWNAIRFCRLSNFNRNHLNIYPMLWSNYLKVAWRQLGRDKLYASINVLGIALGIASFLIVFSYIQQESSYDQHHPHKDRMYRIGLSWLSEEGEWVQHAPAYSPLSRAIADQVPAIEKTARIFRNGGDNEGGGQFTNIETKARYIEAGFYFADSTFFELFDYPFVEGTPSEALQAPFSIVIKASTAQKYFPDEAALGKVLEFRDDEDTYRFTIGGVVDEPVGPTHFDFDLLASYSTLRTTMPWIESWYYPPVFCYGLLKEGALISDLDQQLAALPDKIFPTETAAQVNFDAQSVPSIHLHSHRTGELQANGQASNLRFIGIIGLFILLIACINYMNLATARASTRLKEISVRRVFGAQRLQLIQQFLGESFLFSALGLVLALILVKVSLPYLSSVLNIPIQFALFASWQTPLLLLGLLIVIALLAGFYPAIFLSALQLSRNMQGYFKSSVLNAISIRKSLVVFQFAVSGVLIAMSLLIQQQVKYLQNKNLGFDEDQVIVIPLRDQKDQINYESLKAEFMQLSTVQSATGSSEYPGGPGVSNFFIFPKNGAFDSLEMLTLTIDHDFVDTYGLAIQAGRNFSTAFTTDATEGFLVNEAFVRRLNWDDPIGQEVTLRHYYRGEQEKKGRVLGVVNDFHYQSLRESVEPLLFHMLPRSYFNNYLSLKVAPSAMSKTLAQLESKWDSFNPNRTFEYTFLDESFAHFYEQERAFNALFQLFTLLAIVIACLGLFALAAFSIERRSKEMAVRKVLGASAYRLVLQLASHFAILSIIALVFALPIAWYFAREWLNNFAYRIDMNGWSFAVAGLAIIILALLTSSYHALKVANLNPAKVLKNDE